MPTIKDIKTVWRSKVIPRDKGCESRVNRNERVRIKGRINNIISENSLKKILVLGIKDKSIFLWSFKKVISFLVYKTKVFFKLLKLMINFRVIRVFGPLFMVVCGLWRFIRYHKHLLNSLLRLEFIILGVFWLLRRQISNVGREIYFSLFFLTLAACEGALGLSLLVQVVRRHGSDRFRRLNLLEC